MYLPETAGFVPLSWLIQQKIRLECTARGAMQFKWVSGITYRNLSERPISNKTD